MNDNNIKISNDRNKNKNKINEKKDEMSSQNKKKVKALHSSVCFVE